MKMEMNNFRALTFCTQTPVNPLRQIIFPLRGTAVKNKQKKNTKYLKSQSYLSWEVAHFVSPRHFGDRTGQSSPQTNWEDLLDHSTYWDLRAERQRVIFMRQLKGLYQSTTLALSSLHWNISNCESASRGVKFWMDFEFDRLTSSTWPFTV